MRLPLMKTKLIQITQMPMVWRRFQAFGPSAATARSKEVAASSAIKA